MKKKKLKKRIEHLERRIDGHANVLLKRVNKLEEDNKYYKEWMDRSGVDYKSWFNFDEKTCNTCKWEPLMKQGGQDIPCIGCTADDKKMWKSKED